MNNYTSRNNFWSNFPLVSGLVIAASIFMYLGYLLDPNRGNDNLTLKLMAPDLDAIRDGSYWGLFTSSLIQTNVIFFVWGIGWFWYFGKTIENRVNVFFYLLLVTSSMIFPELFQILIFEETGYGHGGIIYALIGFTWFMSVTEPTSWSFSHTARVSAITFIFLCIVLDYLNVIETAVGAMIGGFLWGVFIGFASTSIKATALKILIPTFVLGAFLVPVFWAPWQISWLSNQASKYKQQNEFEKAKEYYSRILQKEPKHTGAKEELIGIFGLESDEFFKKGDFEKSKASCLQILELEPENEVEKKHVRRDELYLEYLKYYRQKECEKSKKPLDQILEIIPDDEYAQEFLERAEICEEFLKYLSRHDFKMAERTTSRILEIDPDDEDTKKLLQWGDWYRDFVESYDHKDFDKAEKYLAQLLETAPSNEELNKRLQTIRDRRK